MKIESTLVLMKPSVIRRGIEDELYNVYRKRSGLQISTLKLLAPTREFWEQFYVEHRERSFFEELMKLMTLAHSIALLMEGHNAVQTIRQLNGATDPNKAEHNTIRWIYGSGLILPDNVVHGSDSVESARREIAAVFGYGAGHKKPGS